jgi:hypothetical protein
MVNPVRIEFVVSSELNLTTLPFISPSMMVLATTVKSSGLVLVRVIALPLKLIFSA